RRAFAGHVPRLRAAHQSRGVLRGVQPEAGRQALSSACGAREDLVEVVSRRLTFSTLPLGLHAGSAWQPTAPPTRRLPQSARGVREASPGRAGSPHSTRSASLFPPPHPLSLPPPAR